MTEAQPVTDFMGRTSAHGFGMIGRSRNARRFLWCLLTIGAFSGFSYHATVLTMRFLSSPKTVEHEFLKDKFVFPEITFCPTHEFSKEKFLRVNDTIEDLKSLWILAFQANREMLLDFHPWLTQMAYHLDLFKWPQDHIIHCKYTNETCDFRNFTVYKHPTKFICFKFTPENKSFSKQMGPDGGLQLVLNFYGGMFSESIGDDDIINGVDGYEINIHSNFTRPSFESDRIIAQVGTLLNVGLEMHERVGINTPQFPCLDKPMFWTRASDLTKRPSFDRIMYKYSHSDCTITNRQKYILSICGCLDEKSVVTLDMAKQGYRFCNGINMTLFNELQEVGFNLSLSEILQNKGIVRMANGAACYTRQINKFLQSPESQLECLLITPCKDTTYKYTVQSIKWPSATGIATNQLFNNVKKTIELAEKMGKPIDPGIMLKFNESKNSSGLGGWKEKNLDHEYVFINIYPISLRLYGQKEALILPFSEFVATIGGILGLWIGCSVITLCEFVEVFGILIISLLRIGSK